MHTAGPPSHPAGFPLLLQPNNPAQEHKHDDLYMIKNVAAAANKYLFNTCVGTDRGAK